MAKVARRLVRLLEPEKFYATYTNSEFNPTNAFETGKVAMVFDGEWRTAFIRREHPSLAYATAPFPAADPSLYGSGRVGGTIVGIPRGHEAPAGGVGSGEVPGDGHATTWSRSRTPRERADHEGVGRLAEPQPGAAVPDVRRRLEQPEVDVLSTAPAGGAGYAQLADDFDAKWQAGNVSNLQPGLQQLDTNIDNQIQQGETP